MRKKDKEIVDAAAVEDVLSRAAVCRLGLCDDNVPYVVPLCFGYEDGALYFHCGREGKKLDIIRKNENVCFEVEADCAIVKADKACDWSMKFKSVIGFGKAVFVEDVELKRKALDVIMRQYSNGTFDYPQETVAKTTVIKVEIKTMTGKQSTRENG